MMLSKSSNYNAEKKWYLYACFGACVLFFSIYLHVKLGMDAFWDTANYHVFLGWTALSQNFIGFGAAAQYHSYLNPLIDIINYITFYTHPYVGATFHSIAYLVSAFLVLKIIQEFFSDNLQDNLLAVFGCAVSITGAMTVSLFGSWTNENIVLIPVLIGFYFLLKGLEIERYSMFLIAGVAFGAAGGLKLTAAHYLVGGFFTVLICSLNIRFVVIFSFGLLVGFLLTDGYFMYVRWDNTGNPIFPLANNIFKSPYYVDGWMSFSKFELSNLYYYLSLPVIWLFSGDFSEADTVRDGRLLLGYLGCALIVVSFFLNQKIDRRKAALVVFFIFSFLAWIFALRIYRYLVGLEAISGILLVVGMHSIFMRFNKYLTVLTALLCSLFLVYVTNYPDWGRRSWDNEFLSNNINELIDENKKNAVLFAEQRVSYLAPELDRLGAKFANLYSQPWWDVERGKSVRDSGKTVDPQGIDIRSFDNVYFLQYSRFDPRTHSNYLSDVFSDKYYECVEVSTNFSLNPYLCHYNEMGEIPAIELGKKYDHSSNYIVFQNGWSHDEATHRWTDGEEVELLVRLKSAEQCTPSISLKGNTLGIQETEIFVDGVKGFSDVLEGDFLIQFNAPIAVKENEALEIDFILPDARAPGNGDSRALALAFDYIAIDCK